MSHAEKQMRTLFGQILKLEKTIKRCRGTYKYEETYGLHIEAIRVELVKSLGVSAATDVYWDLRAEVFGND